MAYRMLTRLSIRRQLQLKSFRARFYVMDVSVPSPEEGTRATSCLLLLIIFGLVYHDMLLRFPWARRQLLEEDFTSASLFPYAIASVSALWRDAMSLEPKFWQRVIIFIDDPAISLSTLATTCLIWKATNLIASCQPVHGNAESNNWSMIYRMRPWEKLTDLGSDSDSPWLDHTDLRRPFGQIYVACFLSTMCFRRLWVAALTLVP
jgi:hypothetical protein